jgi:hypothetical protein
MSIERLVHLKRMVHYLGVTGIFAFAGGCGDSYDTVAPPAAADPRRVTQESQKAGRAKVIAESRERSNPQAKHD